MRFILAVALVFAALNSQAQIKNTQNLLGGALTRAGNKGMKELNDQQLTQLCEQGYSNAYFLYDGAKARTISCSRGSIAYKSTSTSNAPEILDAISRGIRGGGAKVFVHCYNGAHASGLIAALALKQFCDYSSDQAFAYWKSTLNGYPLGEKGTAGVQKRISAFSPSSSLRLGGAEKAQLCR